MSIRAAKAKSGPQTSQQVSSVKQANQGSDTGGAGVGQDFNGIMAMFAGLTASSTTTSSDASADIFKVDPPQDPATNSKDIQNVQPTDIQTATQASALTSTKVDPDSSSSKKRDQSQPQQDQDENSDSDTESVSAVSTTAPTAAKTSSHGKSSGDKHVETQPHDVKKEASTATHSDSKGKATGTENNAVHARAAEADSSASFFSAAAGEKVAGASNTQGAVEQMTKEQLQTALATALQSAQAAASSASSQNGALVSQIVKAVASSGDALSSIQQIGEIAPAAASASTATSQSQNLCNAFSSQAQSGAAGETKSSRPLSTAAANSALDRVQEALKEVAQSKDGKTISFRLDPPQLGSVRVDVTLKEDALHARVTASDPQVTQLLRERAQDLQSTLRKLGLNVDRVTVSVQSEGQSFGQLNDHLEKNNSQSSQSGSPDNESGVAEDAAAVATTSSTPAAAQLDHWVA